MRNAVASGLENSEGYSGEDIIADFDAVYEVPAGFTDSHYEALVHSLEGIGYESRTNGEALSMHMREGAWDLWAKEDKSEKEEHISIIAGLFYPVSLLIYRPIGGFLGILEDCFEGRNLPGTYHNRKRLYRENHPHGQVFKPDAEIWFNQNGDSSILVDFKLDDRDEDLLEYVEKELEEFSRSHSGGEASAST